ncbi:MAG: ligase-associated DNA damage response endonuclease PdeM [Verrucomicrobiota bacterium]
MHSLSLQNQTLILYPEGAIFWQKQKALLISDLHLGKSAVFRARGIPVPEGSDPYDLERLTTLLKKTRPQKLIILGDLFHAKESASAPTIMNFSNWKKEHNRLEIMLIEGNHDRSCRDLPVKWNIELMKNSFSIEPFLLSHQPQNQIGLYNIAGHIHPSIKVKDRGHRTTRIPCFYFGEQSALLPSFGSFTGHYTIQPEPNSQIFGIVDNQILHLPQKVWFS